MLDANSALRKLQQGNARYAMGLRSVHAVPTEEKRVALAEYGQKPFAMVLSCADSRVPSEIVFDCGLGELFVVRVAGNIIAPSLIGSLEFAAEKFGTSLCVVMGHTSCGAIQASVACVKENVSPESDNVKKIVDAIAPSVRAVMARPEGFSGEELLDQVTEYNVAHSVSELLAQSEPLKALVKAGKLAIVGGCYCLHTGLVTFFDQGTASNAAREALIQPGTLPLQSLGVTPGPTGGR